MKHLTLLALVLTSLQVSASSDLIGKATCSLVNDMGESSSKSLKFVLNAEEGSVVATKLGNVTCGAEVVSANGETGITSIYVVVNGNKVSSSSYEAKSIASLSVNNETTCGCSIEL